MKASNIYSDARSHFKDGDWMEGLHLMEEASAAGSVKATGFLAFGYYTGRDGIPKDYKKAEKYLLSFISQANKKDPDYSEAHCFLGCIHASGEGGKKDLRKALFHFRISAEQGNPIAKYYYNKLSGKRDEFRLKWIVMPLLFVVIVGFAILSQVGMDETMATVLSVVLCTAIATAFIVLSAKDRPDISTKQNLASKN